MLTSKIKFRIGKPVQSSVLVKLTLTFMLPTVFLLMILAWLLPSLYSNEMQKDVHAITQLTLANIGTALINLSDNARMDAYSIYNDRSTQPLLQKEFCTPEERFASAVHLKNIILLNHNIYSINIVKNGKITLTQGGSPLINETYDQLIPFFQDSPPILTLLPRVFQDKSQRMQVLSAYYTASTEKTGYKDCVIVNYYPNALLKAFLSQTMTMAQNILIADLYGNVIFSKDSTSFAMSIADEPFYRAVRLETNTFGVIKLPIDGKQSILHYRIAGKGHFYLLYISHAEELYARTYHLRNTILIICGVLLLVFILMIILISYKIYIPISQLFSNIRILLGEKNEPSGILRESQTLTALFGKTIQRLNNLEQLQTGFLAENRNKFFQDILDTCITMTAHSFQKSITQYHTYTPNRNYRMILFKILHYENITDHNTNESVQFRIDAMEGIINNTFSSLTDHTLFQTSPSVFVVLISCSLTHESVCLYHPATAISSIEKTTAQLLGMKLTVCVGHLLNHLLPEDIKSEYVQMIERSSQQFYFEENKEFYLEEAEPNLIDTKELEKISAQLITALHNNANMEYVNTLSIFFKTLHGAPLQQRTEILAKTALNLVSIPNQFKKTTDENRPIKWSMEAIIEVVRGFETQKNAIEWFINLFDGANEVLENIRHLQAGDLGDAATKLIHKLYHDRNLSAGLLADKLGISPQYFSRIFFQYTQMSFPDYVNHVRLDKAYSFLQEEKPMSMQKICDLTGFNNTSYFGAAFKKKYGVPPSKIGLLLKNAKKTESSDGQSE